MQELKADYLANVSLKWSRGLASVEDYNSLIQDLSSKVGR